MSLTVREKEHWKERIARRIDHAIEELQAAEDPGFQERIWMEAEGEAWVSLGLKKLKDEQDKIEKLRKELYDREQRVLQELHSRVSGTPVDRVRTHYCTPSEVTLAVKRRKLVHEKEILATTPLGQKVLRLQHEKEELLDTVWLATSPSQIKELWSRFTEVLNWEPPTLQKKAIEIDPFDSQS